MSAILVVDDEKSMRITLSELLREEGHVVDLAENGETALRKLQAEPYDLVLSDLKMDEIDGLDVLKGAKAISAEIEVILVTAHGTIGTAVEAMKHGAADFLTKPFDPDELLIRVEKALERRRLVHEAGQLRREARERAGGGSLLGGSAAIKRVLDLVDRVAPTDSTVLVEGESGTGKELVARAIHEKSGRAGRSFIPVNCGAFPEGLLESELFGHIKGAFTGAASNRKGLFEEADRGTIFLDEASDTTPATQVKLLRVLQEHEIRRLGSNQPLRIDVRVIAATNRNLKTLVNEGKFRDDLFYRLSVFPIHIAPLRDRREDILLLAEHFLRRCAVEMHKPVVGFETGAARLLEAYGWPGNVRELENALERAVILATGEKIGAGDLPPEVQGASPDLLVAAGTRGLTLEEMERNYILTTLDRFQGDRGKTADFLKIGRNTLWRKLKQYGRP